MPLGSKPPEPAPQQHGRRGLAALYQSKTAGHAVSFIDSLGLEMPAQPVNEHGTPLCPKLPADVTKLAPDALSRLMGEFTAMAQYAEAQLALADIDHVEYEHGADVTEAQHGLHVEGANAAERNFQLRLNPQVRRAKEEMLARRARKVLLGKLIAGYERAINVLSRDLTRRGVEMSNA